MENLSTTPEEVRSQSKVAAVFSDHLRAEGAVRELAGAGFDMRHLSIVGRDYHTEERVTGFYNAGDRVKYWGKQGAFWGSVFGILFAPAFFVVPGIGPILTGGIIGSAIMGMLEGGLLGAAAGAGLSTLGAALVSLGIPEDSVLHYERQLGADRYVLLVHGDSAEVARAREILARMATETTIHPPA
ncbi:MAG: hypothetical protein KC619_26480 [Myxococcales bacterium]|nr:hypothetical protein [Myxococcales bacterium]